MTRAAPNECKDQQDPSVSKGDSSGFRSVIAVEFQARDVHQVHDFDSPILVGNANGSPPRNDPDEILMRY